MTSLAGTGGDQGADRPKVSVAMITYNHERFVAQAVESVLMQRASFDYELVIGEDASDDATPDIVQRYQQTHPGIIRLVTSERNVGMVRNLARTIEACRGEYIALLEGDDYWTSPEKLEVQVACLDADRSAITCFHNVLQIPEDGGHEPRFQNSPDQKPISELRDLLERNFIATCSAMFRAGAVGRFPEWFFALPWGDWPLHVLNARQGSIRYIDQVMGVYRVHPNGAWRRMSQKQQVERKIICFELLRRNTDLGHVAEVRREISTLHYNLARLHARDAEWRDAQRHALTALRLAPFNPAIRGRKFLYLLRKPYTSSIRDRLPSLCHRSRGSKPRAARARSEVTGR
jgi:glycosyltransferase involved in cell wall biosynthesis